MLFITFCIFPYVACYFFLCYCTSCYFYAGHITNVVSLKNNMNYVKTILQIKSKLLACMGYIQNRLIQNRWKVC